MQLLFNEFDPFAAAWLRQLFPSAAVDQRSIADVSASDILGYDRVHLFGGIGGWELALRLAGWPTDWRVLTGSCPCQPFSEAGKQKGQADERHLWPEMFRIICESRFPVVFGEQVASAVRFGWLDGVFADLEREGYACGAIVLGAHSVGAPHLRQRIYWVAKSQSEQLEWPREPGINTETHGHDGDQPGRLDSPEGGPIAATGCNGGLGHTDSTGPQQRGRGPTSDRYRGAIVAASRIDAWSDYDVIPCRDGKARRVESGTFPLAHGVPNRVGLLRGYGNAIVPQLAAAFIKAFIDTQKGVQANG